MAGTTKNKVLIDLKLRADVVYESYTTLALDPCTKVRRVQKRTRFNDNIGVIHKVRFARSCSTLDYYQSKIVNLPQDRWDLILSPYVLFLSYQHHRTREIQGDWRSICIGNWNSSDYNNQKLVVHGELLAFSFICKTEFLLLLLGCLPVVFYEPFLVMRLVLLHLLLFLVLLGGFLLNGVLL